MLAVGILYTGILPCSNMMQARMLSWFDNQIHGVCLQSMQAFSSPSERYSPRLHSISATLLGSLVIAGNTLSPPLHLPTTMPIISCSIILFRDGLSDSLLVNPFLILYLVLSETSGIQISGCTSFSIVSPKRKGQEVLATAGSILTLCPIRLVPK